MPACCPCYSEVPVNSIATWLHCSVQGMSNEDLKSLQNLVEEQTQENIGMAMIYTIMTAAQEWMQDKVSIGACTRPASACVMSCTLTLLPL